MIVVIPKYIKMVEGLVILALLGVTFSALIFALAGKSKVGCPSPNCCQKNNSKKSC